MDIGLINTVSISYRQDEIFFEIGSSPPILKGLNKLVQIFLVQVITDPGSDALVLEMGGGISSMLGSPINLRDLSATKATVGVKFGEAEQQILAEQEELDLPDDERLLRSTVLDVKYDEARQELQIDFTVENARGERAFVRL